MNYEQELRQLEAAERVAGQRRQAEERQIEREWEAWRKEQRWQRELEERADGKPMDLWVRWYEV